MFVVKIPRSKYYQIVYFINGKRTTHSTKTTNKKEAQRILFNFENSSNIPKQEILLPPIKNNSLLLSQFKAEYLEYVRPIKSKKYVDTISSSFKQFILFVGDIHLDELDTPSIDQFITNTLHELNEAHTNIFEP